MKRTRCLLFVAASILLVTVLDACRSNVKPDKPTGLMLHMRTQAIRLSDSTNVAPDTITKTWKPEKTAIIVTDMWDRHWCKGATARVAELAPFMNKVIETARSKGILIVYAPSDCMDYYKNYAGRKEALRYHDSAVDESDGEEKLASEKDAPWPIDQSDGGCTDAPRCQQGRVWRKQIDALTITDKDIISDSGNELLGIFAARGIDNVMLMGVHTNMCIIHRPFGLRNMVRAGKNVVLVRDLTDAMYDPRQPPYVNHFEGVHLVLNYIEKYISPTIISSDISGSGPFSFSGDLLKLAYRGK